MRVCLLLYQFHCISIINPVLHRTTKQFTRYVCRITNCQGTIRLIANVGTAQTVASYKLARTSFVVPWAVSTGTGAGTQQHSFTSITAAANRIMAHVVERAPSERGIRVLWDILQREKCQVDHGPRTIFQYRNIYIHSFDPDPSNSFHT